MSWLAWAAIYGVGAIGTALFNAGTLLFSGGVITYPLAILRNAILWPLMLPFLIVDWLANS